MLLGEPDLSSIENLAAKILRLCTRIVAMMPSSMSCHADLLYDVELRVHPSNEDDHASTDDVEQVKIFQCNDVG